MQMHCECPINSHRCKKNANIRGVKNCAEKLLLDTKQEKEVPAVKIAKLENFKSTDAC